MKINGVKSGVEDMSKSWCRDSSQKNNLNKSERHHPIKRNIGITGMESDSDNNDNGPESIYNSSDTIRDGKSANTQSESDTSEQSTQSNDANGSESSHTISAKVQGELNTTKVPSFQGTSPILENPIKKAESQNEHESTVEFSMRNPEHNKQLYYGPEDSSQSLKSIAEIEEQSAQKNYKRSEQNEKPYKSDGSSVGNEPNSTMKILEHAFQNNREVAARNLVKYAENGKQFAFGEGAPPKFKGNNDVQLLESAPHDNYNINPQAKPVKDKLPVMVEQQKESSAELVVSV